MDGIKFVYFDIGGVMIEDFSATDKWEQMILGWGVVSEKVAEVKKRFNEFEKEVLVGRNVNDFLPILEKDFGTKLPEGYDMNRDFVDKFYKNWGIWEIVKDCQKKYGVGLLTNAYPGMLEMIDEGKLLPEIEWKVIIDSSMVKCKKPEKGIYEIAQNESGVRPEEILFIDNAEKNLIMPRNLGWKTFLYNSGDYEVSNRELKEFLET